MTRLLPVALIFLALACGHGSRQSWTAQPVSSESIRVMPAGISVRGDRLYVQTTFTNTGSEPITVERDGVTLRLPDGRVLARSVAARSVH